jgi:4-amino-4-deoxy-L-arabinose transferase-like glycosyltransferase
MLYREPIPNKHWWLFLLLVFVALYLPHLGVRELRTGEAMQVAVARDMVSTGNGLETSVFGHPVSALPLYSWLVVAGERLGLPPEWSGRLPAVLAILALAGLCGRVAARSGGHLAGAMAGAMAMSTLMMLRHGSEAQGDLVCALLLNIAWFFWYRLGRVYKQWGAAWVVALMLVTLAAFGMGVGAYVLFYFPLFFLRRPLRVWPRILNVPHLLAWAGVLTVIGLWLAAVPGQTLLSWKTTLSLMIPQDTGSYLWHLLLFPLDCAVALLPWSFLVWPAFCVAFRPVERTPILCRFLRGLILSLFFAAWLLPDTTPWSLLPVIGPLAVLTGLHADILLRRHAAPLFRLTGWLASGALAASVSGFVLLCLCAARVVVVDRIPPVQMAMAAVFLGVAVLLTLHLRRPGINLPFWARFLLVILCFQLVVLAVYPPYHAAYCEQRRELSRRLSQHVPATATIYRFGGDFLVAECLYLDRPVRDLPGVAALPVQAQAVYVLGGPKAPILETRTWTPVSDAVPLAVRSRPVWQWRPAEGGLLRLNAVPEVPAPERLTLLRLYRGDLRPVVRELPGVASPPSVTDPNAGGAFEPGFP